MSVFEEDPGRRLKVDYKITRVFVDNHVKKKAIVKDFIEKSKPRKIIFTDQAHVKEGLKTYPFDDGKRSVFLSQSKGRYFKTCPGMEKPYICCNLGVLNIISNCPMSCSYCFLQFYLNSPVTTVYTDFSRVTSELKVTSKAHPEIFFRVTTGELSDSLALDRETGFSARLIEIFKDIPNAILELKTKTSFVNHLLRLNHGGRTVISWSLNPQRVIDKEEKGTASLEKRITTASKAQEAGYLLGFHFDPLIHYPQWEKDYEETVKLLFEKVSPFRIAWISLGSLRFAPGMEEEIKRAHPSSKLPYGEMVVASCGKKRYVKPIRLRLYQKMIDWIKKYGGQDVLVYLCMETPEAWEKTMSFKPESTAHLDFVFAESLHQRFEYLFTKKPLLNDYLKGMEYKGLE